MFRIARYALFAAVVSLFVVDTSLAAPAASAKARSAARSHRSTRKSLVSEAKVSEKDARAVALAAVPGGVVKSEELEREHGKLIYSYDITVPAHAGVDEINVNAIDGTIVARSHESAAKEKKEARSESRTDSRQHP